MEMTMNTKLWSLTAGALAMGTGSLVVAGVLAPLAAELGVSTALAGQLVTAFAIAFAIGAPLAALLLARWCRRRVLLLGLSLFGVASLVGALAPSFGWLLASRVLAGLGAAIFTPNATAVAASLVPPEQRGRAIATVFGGFTLASVFGVPLGTWLGLHVGWRETLGVVVVLAVLATVLVAWRIRGRIELPPADLRSWITIGRDRQALRMLATTGLAIAGTYTVFSYVGPFLASRGEVSADGVAALLMLFGAAGVVGNAASGRLIDQLGARRMVLTNLGLVAVGLLLLALPGAPLAATLAGLALWGGGVFAVNSAQQARLVAHSPALSGALLPANASVLYVGQALGGAAGAVLLASNSATALAWLPGAGLVFVLFALASILLASGSTGEPISRQPQARATRAAS
jgi:predicted MFS family arabinose efflux permease